MSQQDKIERQPQKKKNKKYGKKNNEKKEKCFQLKYTENQMRFSLLLVFLFFIFFLVPFVYFKNFVIGFFFCVLFSFVLFSCDFFFVVVSMLWIFKYSCRIYDPKQSHFWACVCMCLHIDSISSKVFFLFFILFYN